MAAWIKQKEKKEKGKEENYPLRNDLSTYKFTGLLQNAVIHVNSTLWATASR